MDFEKLAGVIPDRGPKDQRRERPQAQEGAKGDDVFADQNPLQQSDHGPYKWGQEEDDEHRLLAEEGADHCHQSHVTKAHRFALEDRAANEADQPDDAAAHGKTNRCGE